LVLTLFVVHLVVVGLQDILFLLLVLGVVFWFAISAYLFGEPLVVFFVGLSVLLLIVLAFLLFLVLTCILAPICGRILAEYLVHIHLVLPLLVLTYSGPNISLERLFLGW